MSAGRDLTPREPVRVDAETLAAHCIVQESEDLFTGVTLGSRPTVVELRALARHRSPANPSRTDTRCS